MTGNTSQIERPKNTENPFSSYVPLINQKLIGGTIYLSR
jgi:hypothetical protein